MGVGLSGAGPMPTYLGAAPTIRAAPGMSLPTDFPSYRWLAAPVGLATRRQLAALGLRPAQMAPVAQITWRRGARWAGLYPIHLAVPKRTPTARQLAALDLAMAARRTCPACGTDVGYVLPTRFRVCIDCHPTKWSTHP